MTAVAKNEPTQIVTPELQAKRLLHQATKQLKAALADRIDMNRFASICVTAITRGGPRMAEALAKNPQSFLSAVMEAAQIGLLPDAITGQSYLLPVFDKDNGMMVEFRIGYRGYLELARRGGVAKFAARVVYENDICDVRLGSEEEIHHVPYCVRTDAYFDEPGEMRFAYAVAEMQDGGRVIEITSMNDIKLAMAASGNPKSPDPSPVWKKYPEAMARKTAARRIAKWLPLPDSAMEAAVRDELREVGERDKIPTVEQVEPDRVDRSTPLDQLISEAG